MNADALLHWLLRTSLEASLLILAVLGLRLMLGARLSPAWRIGLWLLVGTKLMLPAFIPAGFGLGAWFQSDKTDRKSDASGAPIVSSVESVRTADVADPQTASDSLGGVAESTWMPSRYDLAAGLWLMGALSVFAAALYRQRRFDLTIRQRPIGTAPLLRDLLGNLCQKAGIHQFVRIILMPASTTPAVVGIVQPRILLPEDWERRFDERSLRHVLLHELLHVKHHDLIWNWAATMVQAFHWFNPLVWFVVSRFQADRELRCDAGALELLSPTERLDYGHTLLRIQETFFAPPAMAGLAPCVRNHPTLRQRIHMVAHPPDRQPVLQLLLVLTLSALVCYSFTTALGAEKEVPAKERTREGVRTPSTEQPKTEAGKAAPTERSRKGDAKKPDASEGDGGTKKTGPRDGEGSNKTGMRDGEKPRTGDRDDEGRRKTGARDGDKTAPSSETITLRVIKNGGAVMVGETEVFMGSLRGHLSTFLPNHPGARVVVTGEDNVPMSAMNNTVDAVRDNGNKNVGIKAE